MRLDVNGLPVEAAFHPQDVERVLRPLAWRIAALGEERRAVVLLAGPPGAGKSTLAQVLAGLCGPGLVQVLGMDGFHRSNAWLAEHGLLERKGAPETFDFGALEGALAEPVTWPRYSRTLHEPCGEDPVTGRVLLVEGNYLLAVWEPWARLARFSGLSVYLGAPEDVLRERLVARKLAGGFSREEAECHAEGTDLPNARLVAGRRRPADVELAWTSDGRLTCQKGSGTL